MRAKQWTLYIWNSSSAGWNFKVGAEENWMGPMKCVQGGVYELRTVCSSFIIGMLSAFCARIDFKLQYFTCIWAVDTLFRDLWFSHRSDAASAKKRVSGSINGRGWDREKEGALTRDSSSATQTWTRPVQWSYWDNKERESKLYRCCNVAAPHGRREGKEEKVMQAWTWKNRVRTRDLFQ